MCRIVGLLEPAGSTDIEKNTIAMRDAMEHGGPDGFGIWTNESRTVCLGHRHLAIIGSISVTNQPMRSASGRYVIAFNGEILNFREIKTYYERSGIVLKRESDTELFLEAWAFEGMACLHRFHGFFAAAIHDTLTGRIYLVSDRVGIKPLHVWRYGKRGFAFASEIKAFLKHPMFSKSVNAAAMQSMLKHNYIAGPLAIYKDVEKLLPGSVLVVENDGSEWSTRWWDYSIYENERRASVQESRSYANLKDAIVTSLERRMVADVPVGVFLSSGVDSTLIATLLRHELNVNVPTFTCSFAGQSNDESVQAAATAKRLGFENYCIDASPENVASALELLPHVWDEPFGDSSTVPMLILSEFTSRQINCVLSADGGDELFFGYPKYNRTIRNAAKLSAIPAPLFESARRIVTDFLPGSVGWLDRYRQLLENCCNKSEIEAAAYVSVCTYLTNREINALLPGHESAASPLKTFWRSYSDYDFLSCLKATDLATYHAFDIQVKVDRATMRFGLEAREPLLDQDIIRHSFLYETRNVAERDIGKKPLRSILDEYDMGDAVSKQKKGFGSPIESWLLQPRYSFLLDPIRPENIRKVGIFNPAAVSGLLENFKSSPGRYAQKLWNVICVQRWAETWL